MKKTIGFIFVVIPAALFYALLLNVLVEKIRP